MPPAPAPAAAPPAANSQQALQNLQSFQGGMKSPTDMLTGAQQQYGVPQGIQQVSGLRQAITNTTNLLNHVAPSVYGRTADSLVTNAQAGRQISNEQAPIQTELGQQNTDYTNANSDLERNISQAHDQATLGLQGQDQQLGNLRTIYDSLYKQEQDALSQQLEQQKLAETKRQFNLTPHGGSGSGNITINPSGNNSGGNNSGSAASMTAKNGSNGTGGYAFTTTGNQPISAAKYAQLSGVPLSNLLQSMAQAGDAGAAKAFNQLQSAQDVVAPGQLGNWAKRNLSSFFWDM